MSYDTSLNSGCYFVLAVNVRETSILAHTLSPRRLATFLPLSILQDIRDRILVSPRGNRQFGLQTPLGLDLLASNFES